MEFLLENIDYLIFILIATQVFLVVCQFLILLYDDKE